MLKELTSQHFKPYLNQTFTIHVDAKEQIDAQLTSVTDLGTASHDETARRAFSLIFRGPMDRVLPQRIYHLAHDEMSDLDIFLVPIGPDNEGMQYEALFT